MMLRDGFKDFKHFLLEGIKIELIAKDKIIAYAGFWILFIVPLLNVLLKLE